MPIFARTIGIDYSGAETPTASLKGLRVYMADGDRLPVEVPPPSSPRKYWTRKGIAEWLVERLAEDVPTLVGIDHGFSFPLRYFEAHGLLPKWSRFLDDFQRHWPTDEDHTYVQFVRDGIHGNGDEGRRLSEARAGGAKLVFHFDVQGSVAKSAHAGIPWLRFIRGRDGHEPGVFSQLHQRAGVAVHDVRLCAHGGGCRCRGQAGLSGSSSCCATPVALREPTKATIPERYRPTSATATSSTRCDTPSCRRAGSRTSGSDQGQAKTAPRRHLGGSMTAKRLGSG